MKRIKRSNFINAFNRVKRSRKLSTAKVARSSSLSRSYVYHVVSPRYKMDITPATARKVGKGLGLNQSQIKKWLHSMKLSQKSKSVKKPVAHHFQVHHRKKINANHHQSEPMTVYQRKLIRTVRDLMSTRGISTQKLAEHSGLNEQRVSDYIHGKVSSISKLTIVRLARGLNVKPTKLLNLNYSHSQSRTKSIHRDIENEQLVNKPESYSSKQPASAHRQPMRRSVKRIMKDINKLNDADIAIVDLIVNRISEAEHHDKK